MGPDHGADLGHELGLSAVDLLAALDQSGGSTPKALKGYGIDDGSWTSDEEMFGLIHQMRQRIIETPCFGNGKVIGDNLTVETLKRFKDDATEVRTDFECGIGLGSYNDITEGDIIETFEMREKPRV